MIDPLIEKLETERSIGADYERSWNGLVKPFFDKKQEELFEVFKELPTTNSEGLMLVKTSLNALQMLEDEFRHYINTGKMASQTLNDLEKEKDHAA